MLIKLAKAEDNFDKMVELLGSSDFKTQRENPSFEEYAQDYQGILGAAFRRIYMPELRRTTGSIKPLTSVRL
jgi:hypothetical protein